MAQILRSLNEEWSVIADSPDARRALMRWSAAHSVLVWAANLDDVIALGYRPDEGPEVRRALALLAPTDCEKGSVSSLLTVRARANRRLRVDHPLVVGLARL